MLGSQLASGQEEASSYRKYVLGSSVEAIVAATGARATAVKTIHERPASIRELVWQAPYVSSADGMADPMRQIAFTFYNDALYQVVVSYDRHRTEGLTNTDLIASISETYGTAAVVSSRTPTTPMEEVFPDAVVLARWDRGESQLTLIRGSYPPEFQLILAAKELSTRARSAIREAVRLDAIDAPRRDAAQRQKEAGDATEALDKARAKNKPAFRP
jgi:hypothetical protein